MRRKKISIMIILVAIFALIFPAGAVAVPPPAPNRFHGTVTVNGTAAFDGTVIEARVGAEVRATTVTAAGRYGYFPQLLEVHGSINEIIHFYADGIRALQTAMFKSGHITRLDLTAVARRYTLTVAVDPAEGGTVALDPPQPEEGYIKRTPVTLTASAATGHTFSHWSGNVTGTESTITITMNAAKAVTAHFADVAAPPPVRYTLAVTIDPDGGGTVTLTPSQPAEGYIKGTPVALTAVPATGYRFSRWSGDATGTESTIALVMNAAKSVTAHFAQVAPPPPTAASSSPTPSSIFPGGYY